MHTRYVRIQWRRIQTFQTKIWNNAHVNLFEWNECQLVHAFSNTFTYLLYFNWKEGKILILVKKKKMKSKRKWVTQLMYKWNVSTSHYFSFIDFIFSTFYIFKYKILAMYEKVPYWLWVYHFSRIFSHHKQSISFRISLT